MNRITKILSLILILGFTSCFEEEEFSDVPRIEFQNILFIDTEFADSLMLSLSFEDGGADIGLDNVFSDLYKPYQIYDLIIDAQDSAITISDGNVVPPLYKAPVYIDEQNGELAYFFFPEDKEFFSDTYDRPAYECDNYEIIESDTFYVARNEFHNNFHIEFQQRNVDGLYSPLDFNDIFNTSDCSIGNFDGRVPFFDSDGKSGTLTYAMISQVFRLAFADDSIRLRFYLYDRKLNKSNEVVSPSFLLKDITVTQ